MKRVLRHPAVRALGAWALLGYIRFALRTTRWEWVGADAIGAYMTGGAAVVAFWHEQLLLMPSAWVYARAERRRRGEQPGKLHVLVSRHQDGRTIGRMFEAFDFEVVHGSSGRDGVQKGGAAGVRALLGLLKGGAQVAITPDGPRGPRREVAAGVAQIAGLAGVPVLPLAVQTRSRRVLNTWDRMVVPLPFGRGVLTCGAPIHVPREGWAESLPAIQAGINAASDRADAACGLPARTG